MLRLPKLLSDPMIVVLLLATVLALLLPSQGETRDYASQFSNAAIFVLFLVNGMRIPRSQIAKGFVNWKFFVPLLLWVFGAMALMGLGFSLAAEIMFPPIIALGFIFLGCLPSTIQSATSYTNLAGGNVGLSVVAAALINLLGVLVSAPLFALLSGSESVLVGKETILKIGIILILPFVIGQLIQKWTIEWLAEHKSSVAWLDRGVIGIAVYVAMSGAVEQGILEMFTLIEWFGLVGIVVAFLGVATLTSWLFASALKLASADRTAFLFAGSQKSVAIGAPLAAILFSPEIAGFVLAPLLIYHLLQLVIAAPLARALADRQS